MWSRISPYKGQTMKNSIPDMVIIGVFLIPVVILFLHLGKDMYIKRSEKHKKLSEMEKRIDDVESLLAELKHNLNKITFDYDLIAGHLKEAYIKSKEAEENSKEAILSIQRLSDEQVLLKKVIEMVANDLEEVKEDTKFIMEVA
jgi:septal ring factor EnvC (AmiA/AmiB activator)